MKKLYSIISIFIVFLSFANGQSKSESNKQCNIFKQIVELVSDYKLNTIEGSEFVPKYFKVFSWNKCYTATVKIPTAQEIVIFQESNKNKYSCILNDYGADEAKAKEDLKKIVKIFSDWALLSLF